MEFDPITNHIAAMLNRMDDNPRRAVYMVVKELYHLSISREDLEINREEK